MNFQPMDLHSEAVVVAWLHKTHVAEYFHGEGLRNTLMGLQKQVTTPSLKPCHWVALQEEVPFGYLITSSVDPLKNTRFAQHMEPNETAITLDLLIGEERYIGMGLAVPMIHSFLSQKFPHINKVFIDPEAANKRAIHVYEKAGFEKLEQFVAKWHPTPHWLMVLHS